MILLMKIAEKPGNETNKSDDFAKFMYHVFLNKQAAVEREEIRLDK